METKLFLFLILILLSSGCIDEFQSTEKEIPQKGLEIESFKITDSELRPEQEAVITAEFRNYHKEIEVESVELTNVGELLEVSKTGCTPEAENLQGAREGIVPRMVCRWRVTAPEEDEVEGFENRNEPVQLRAVYSGEIENSNPLAIGFSPVEDINSTTSDSVSSSNGEVSIELTSDNPIPTGLGSSLEVNIDNIGNGRVPEGFNFNFEPQRIFDEQCEDGKTKEGIQSDRVTFMCYINAESPGVRNIFISAEYKYVKEPILDVTVVNN